jgi:hypothetical protein
VDRQIEQDSVAYSISNKYPEMSTTLPMHGFDNSGINHRLVKEDSMCRTTLLRPHKQQNKHLHFPNMQSNLKMPRLSSRRSLSGKHAIDSLLSPCSKRTNMAKVSEGPRAPSLWKHSSKRHVKHMFCNALNANQQCSKENRK